MLNPFPTLLSFGILAPTILRIFAGFFLARFGWLKITKDKSSKITFFENLKLKPGIVFLWIISIIEIVAGVMLVVGFLTQIAALIGAVIMLACILIKIRDKKALPNTLDFYILFFLVFISLIFTGAGLFAFDLPL